MGRAENGICGEGSGVVIQIFSAMAAGAAIVCARCIGCGDRDECNRAAVFSRRLLSGKWLHKGMAASKA